MKPKKTRPADRFKPLPLPDLPPLEMRARIAEAVHTAIVEGTGTPGFGKCMVYACVGMAVLYKLTGRLYMIQGGALRVKTGPDTGFEMATDDGGGVDTGEFHCWLGRVHPDRRLEGIDFSARHYREAARRLGIPWLREDAPSFLWDWAEKIFARGICFRAEAETTRRVREQCPKILDDPQVGEMVGRALHLATDRGPIVAPPPALDLQGLIGKYHDRLSISYLGSLDGTGVEPVVVILDLREEWALDLYVRNFGQELAARYLEGHEEDHEARLAVVPFDPPSAESILVAFSRREGFARRLVEMRVPGHFLAVAAVAGELEYAHVPIPMMAPEIGPSDWVAA